MSAKKPENPIKGGRVHMQIKRIETAKGTRAIALDLGNGAPVLLYLEDAIVLAEALLDSVTTGWDTVTPPEPWTSEPGGLPA